MADTVSHAKKEVRHAVNERQEKAAVYWQQAIIEGRQIRQARIEMQAGMQETPTRQQTANAR